MPRRILTIAILAALAALAVAAPARAQGDPLNPGGAIPWPIPNWPLLASPTAYPLRATPTPQAVTYTPTPSPTPSPTPTATPTPAPADSERNDLATLAANNADMAATLAALSGQDIAGQDMAGAAADIGNYARYFFGYVKGLQLNNVRGVGIVITFIITALGFVLLVKVTTGVLPMLTTFGRWTMDLLRLVADFLPF